MLSKYKYNINQIITCQAVIRGYIARKYSSINSIVQSEYQSKNWRKQQYWYVNGKKNEYSCSIGKSLRLQTSP